jgi:hypothetical protein
MIIYNEIKNLKERIADPVEWRENQSKKKKEQDWYYTFKEEEKREHKQEQDFKTSLNPISLFIYENIYNKCCKSKRKSKYNFELKKTS